MIKNNLIFWQKGNNSQSRAKGRGYGELSRLAAAGQSFFGQVQGWLTFPLTQANIATCHPYILSLKGWGRNIDRFHGEPLALYRNRVQFAYVNAKDAGSSAGLKRIFERLGIGYIEVDEVIDHVGTPDWDVITIRLSDSQIANNQKLINLLIGYYGKTCRRYYVEIITPLNIYVSANTFSHHSVTNAASL